MEGGEREVRDVGLVRWEEDRYRMLPPIRAWAQITLPAGELDAYRLRAARWLAEQPSMWNAVLRPSEERRAAVTEVAEGIAQEVGDVERTLTLQVLALFELEEENLLAAVDWACDAGRWELVTELFENLFNFLNIRSLSSDAECVGKKAVDAGRRLGESKKARLALSVSLGNLGTVYHYRDRWDEAIECYEQVLAIFRELGDRHSEGTALMNLGLVYRLQGRWSEAIEKFEESLAICRELGDRHGEGQTLGNLGNVYRVQGRWDEAIECYEQDLAICRELGDRHGEGHTLVNAGVLYKQLGQMERAINLWNEALGKLNPESPEHEKVRGWVEDLSTDR